MQQNLRTQVRELRQQVTSADYRVDSHAVADAIVRRRWAVAVAARSAQPRVIAASSWNRPQALAA